MVATRSKSKNKIRKVLDAQEISYNATCAISYVNFDLHCKVYKIKIEQKIEIAMKGREQQTDCRLKDRRNKSNQR